MTALRRPFTAGRGTAAAAFATLLLLGLSGCGGGSGSDGASSTAGAASSSADARFCRVVAATEGSVIATDKEVRGGSYDPSHSAVYTSASTTVISLLGSVDVTDALAKPTLALIRAWNATKGYMTTDEGADPALFVKDETGAFADVVAACRPYADISTS